VATVLSGVHNRDRAVIGMGAFASVAPAKSAVTKGWTVVNMKDDWKTIFPAVKE